MKLIKELDLLDNGGTGFNVRFFDTQEVEITYFEENHCVDYVFISMGTWDTFFNNKSSGMRDFTKEESESYEKNLINISKPTGQNFYDL